MKKSILIVLVGLAFSNANAQDKTATDTITTQTEKKKKFEKTGKQVRVSKQAVLHKAAFDAKLEDAPATRAVKPEDDKE